MTYLYLDDNSRKTIARTLIDSLIQQDIPAGATPIAVIMQVCEKPSICELYDFGQSTLFQNQPPGFAAEWCDGAVYIGLNQYLNDWSAD